MKILFINQAFTPDLAATAQYLGQLTTALAEAGHDVTVLCARGSYAGVQPSDAEESAHPSVRVHRVRSLFRAKGGTLARLLNGITTNIAFLWSLLFLRGFDRVVALTTPPLVSWCVLLSPGLRRSELILWSMDINPDQAVAMGWIRHGSTVHRILDGALRQVLDRYDRILVLDEYMKKRLEAKGGLPERIEVAPLWADLVTLTAVDRDENPYRERHGFGSKFVVMYSGNVTPCHPLDTVLEAAKRLRSDAEVIFVFIGGGGQLPALRRHIREHALDNVRILGYEPYEQLRYSLSSADLHVVSMGESMVGIVHPSKVYGILAVGRPFVAVGPHRSPIGDLVCEFEPGWQVEHGDVEKLLEVIRAAREQLSGGKLSARRFRSIAERFSLEHFLEQFQDSGSSGRRSIHKTISVCEPNGERPSV